MGLSGANDGQVNDARAVCRIPCAKSVLIVNVALILRRKIKITKRRNSKARPILVHRKCVPFGQHQETNKTDRNQLFLLPVL
jgi:hypothetical protein